MQTATMKLRCHGKSAHVPLSFVLFVLFSSNVFAQSFTDSIKDYANSISSRIAASWKDVTEREELAKAYAAYKQQDYATALKYIRPLAEQGNVRAQYSLGVMYQEGHGVSKDLKQAYFWYLKSAMQGDATAQYNLGYMYNVGSGVDKDAKQAYTWYRKSALQGEPMAENNLGVAYLYGQGVDRDVTQALKWFTKSAAQGVAVAQRNLGVMCEQGLGVAKNQTLALSWYREAADNGDAEAQYVLGVAYDKGQGVPKDAAKAYSWYKKAAAQGNQQAQQALKTATHDRKSLEEQNAYRVCTSGDIAKRLLKIKNPGANPKKLTRIDIEMVFECNKTGIFGIYNEELKKDKHLSGKVILNFDISPSGRVSNLNIVSSDIKDKTLFANLKAFINRFEFPEKSGETTGVSFPIAFLPT